MNTNNYDFVILGGGIGGYSAAIRASQLGKTVAIVEADKLGGTCLHQGCIPSKTFLRSADLYNTIKNSEKFGINTKEVSLDFSKVANRKQTVVDQLHRGVEGLMKRHNIDVYYSRGRVMGPSIFSPRSGTVALDMEEEEGLMLVPKHLIIATGSTPASIPGLTPDGKHVLNSDHVLALEQLPDSIVIVGGGVIGVEWASMLNDFGVQVTIVESMPHLLSREDEHISIELERQLSARGVRILTKTIIQPETVKIEEGKVNLDAEREGQLLTLQADQILVSVGRTPNTSQLGLENTDVTIEQGRIIVNAYMQTNEPHIYAVGDVIGGYQLAHVAAREGILAVEHAAGLKVTPLKSEQIPRCVYSRPEIAAVGLSEQQAISKGHQVKTAVISFQAIGKAWVNGETDGFVKVVADQQTHDLLGVHMIGSQVTELISEAALAQILEATPWEVAQAVHPHPSLAEGMSEAMIAAHEKLLESK